MLSWSGGRTRPTLFELEAASGKLLLSVTGTRVLLLVILFKGPVLRPFETLTGDPR